VSGAQTTADLRGARVAHDALRLTLTTIRDADIRRPSLLPGWTVGHVLTHLARNADGHRNMFVGAAKGAVFPQYPGGEAQRRDEIELGAHRPAAAIVADVESSMAALESQWDGATDEMWASGRCRSFGGEMTLSIQPFRRWREVEIHHHDLGGAFTWRDWSDAYVARELAETIATLGARIHDPLALRSTDSSDVWTVLPALPAAARAVLPALPAAARAVLPALPEAARAVPPDSCSVIEVRGPRRELLAWLVGRHDNPRHPPLEPWL
jgi:maleylpyruvate isomerase